MAQMDLDPEKLVTAFSNRLRMQLARLLEANVAQAEELAQQDVIIQQLTTRIAELEQQQQ